MKIFYKTSKKKPLNITLQDLKEQNLSQYYLPSGKLDPSYFIIFFEKYFLSKVESDIRFGFKALIQYAKEGNIYLFIENDIRPINNLIIDTAYDNGYDFLEDSLRLYKWMTRCDQQQLVCIINENLMDFLYSVYRKPTNLICKSLIFRIFANILSKDDEQLESFINNGYHNKLYATFWKHFEKIETNDDDSYVVASIFKLLPVFYLNNEKITFQDPEFFIKWDIAFTQSLKFGDHRIITPALVESIQKCSNIDNYIILNQFYISQKFPFYFEYCSHYDKKVRLNMILTFLNFKNFDSDDLFRIVDAGLFNIDLDFDVIQTDEAIQFLNVMHEYLLKSLDIAENVAFSKTLSDFNNFGDSLDYKVKRLLLIIFAQLIQTCLDQILIQVFDLCPLYIELSSEFLDSQSEKQFGDSLEYKNIFLSSYFDLLSYIQVDEESDLASTIRQKLFDKEMLESVNMILINDDSSILIPEKATAFLNALKEYYPSDEC